MDRKWLVIGALVGLTFAVSVWAITVDQIWQRVYDSTHTALRINQVFP